MEIIENGDLIKEVVKQGIWAILYVTLYIYTLQETRRQQELATSRENRLREEYQELRLESHERENKLTTFINEISKQYERP